jgi:light-regulated signal transduction histidine kinase (bacteriophytochrome)
VIGLFSIEKDAFTREDERNTAALANDLAIAIENRKAEEEIHQLNDQLEQRVIERTAQLEAANKELEAFSFSVSHDLSAPLRHIIGFTDILKTDISSLLDEEHQHYLGTISDSAKSMRILIGDLLTFSRIGRSEVHKVLVNSDELVQDVYYELQREAQGRDVVWKIDPLPSVEGDLPMLHQLWINLISNALKFTRPCPRAEIAIGCITANDEKVFFIRDNGVGFDMKYTDKLFGVFQRFHSAEQFEGTGIGLANVQRIVQRHGGRIWAESAVDHGATFYFTLGTG